MEREVNRPDDTRPADRRLPWHGCEEHVHVDETSPLPGRWRSDASPWVRAVMEDFANNAVRDIAVQCTAQSAKTQTVMNCACWAIAEDPGLARWVTVTKDELRDFLCARRSRGRDRGFSLAVRRLRGRRPCE